MAADFASAPLWSDFAVGALVARTTVGSLVSARDDVAGFAAAAGAAATGAVGTSVMGLAEGTPVAGVVGAPGIGVGSPFVPGFDAPLDPAPALLGLAIVFGRAVGAAPAAGAGFGVASVRAGVGAGFGVASVRAGVGAGFGVASLRTGVGDGSGRCAGVFVADAAVAVGWRTTVFALVAPADAPARVLVRGAAGGPSVVCFTRSASFSSEATGVCWSCSHSATSIASSSTTEASSSGDFFVTASPR